MNFEEMKLYEAIKYLWNLRCNFMAKSEITKKKKEGIDENDVGVLYLEGAQFALDNCIHDIDLILALLTKEEGVICNQ